MFSKFSQLEMIRLGGPCCLNEWKQVALPSTCKKFLLHIDKIVIFSVFLLLQSNISLTYYTKIVSTRPKPITKALRILEYITIMARDPIILHWLSSHTLCCTPLHFQLLNLCWLAFEWCAMLIYTQILLLVGFQLSL